MNWELLILMSLTCVGWQVVVSQLFNHFTGKWPEDFTPKPRILYFIYKPLIQCVLCHASIIGSIVYFVHIPFEVSVLPHWVIACVCCAYLNGVLYGAFNKIF